MRRESGRSWKKITSLTTEKSRTVEHRGMNDSTAGFSISLLGYLSTAAFNDRHRGAPRASRQKACNDADQGRGRVLATSQLTR